MNRKRIGIIGAGPAAAVTAALLNRAGHRVEVIGLPRRDEAVEGVSWRVIDGLRKAGFANVGEVVGNRSLRVSTWGGKPIEGNGESVVRRRDLDRHLLKELGRMEVPVHRGEVEAARFVDEAWRIAWRPGSGPGRRERLAFAAFDFLIEARGRGAPRSGENEAEGLVSLALTSRFAGGLRADLARTYTEPFSRGWAWASHDNCGNGYLQIVVDPDTVVSGGKDPAALWPALFAELGFIRRRLGPGLRLAGAVGVRGIRPVLRGGRVATNYLRVGDACYSGDPLSGHGIFEAASGAWAALPVVNTLLGRPGASSLAIGYYNRRARSVFASRMDVAGEFYRAEQRWPDEPFWKRRGASLDRFIDDGAGSVRSPERRFVREPVVEDGFVVERRVAVIPGMPRGVRFIDGIDLARLSDEISRAGARPRLNTLSARLGAPREPIANAWRWLLAQDFTRHPVAG